MQFINVEIKARCNHPEKIRAYLQSHQAEYIGLDIQTDTYFKVAKGRLKLREGNIENNLIYYERNNDTGPKDSHFQLIKIEDAKNLKDVLAKTNGIKAVVNKKREIYYIKNVKFHIDEVMNLGSFVEIEAGNMLADFSKEQLKAQCEQYLQLFEIQESDLINISYSDMLLNLS
jgi:predicted adenylyl cyclase CyaB